MKFRSAQHIKKCAELQFNKHVSIEFIQRWCKAHDQQITADWQDEDFLTMITLGDRETAAKRKREL